MDETISLKNDFLELTTSTHGAEMISLKEAQGTEYVWQGDATYWGGHAPILFPIVGKIFETMSIGNDKTVSMQRHGFARHQDFVIDEAIADKIVYQLTENDETLAQYPYPFQLEVAYTLKDNQVSTSFTITNTGSETLPFQIGGHPAFRCPLLDEGNFSDASLTFEKPELIESPMLDPKTGLIDYKRRYRTLTDETTLPLRHELFKQDALIVENPNSNAITLNLDNNTSVRMDFLGFPYLVLWSSSNDGPFICLEPWSGLPSALNEDTVFEHKRGMTLLAPGDSRSFTYLISIEKK